MLASIGAYIASDRQLLTPFGQIGTVVGIYDIPAAYVTIDAVLSNTSPTAPYRGAGRPEASYLIERAIEAAARELGIDPIELRRRNIIPDGRCRTRRRSARSTIAASSAQNMEMALDGVRSRRLPGASRGVSNARQAARHRLRQCDRAGGRSGAGICRDPLPAERQRHVADGHQDARPGPRDGVQADPVRTARHRSRTKSSSSTATPTASRSAWARTARARWWSAVRRTDIGRATRSSTRASGSRRICSKRRRPTSSSPMAGSPSPAPIAGWR